MALIPQPTTSIFQYPQNFPHGQVSDAWKAYFNQIQYGAYPLPAPSAGYVIGWDGSGNLINVANTGANQTAAWTAADAAVTANYIAADTAAKAAVVATSVQTTSLADTTVIGNGDALVGFKQPLSGTVARTQHDRNLEYVSVKDYGAKGDYNGTTGTDDTVAIQACVDANDNVVFPPGRYSVSTIILRREYQTLWFDNAYIEGISTSATAAVVEVTRRQLTVYGMGIRAGYRSNYTAGLKWYAIAPATYYPGFCIFYGLNIQSARIGILFGDLAGGLDAPVSENTIFGYRTRGVIRPLVSNQPNGFLVINGGTMDCQKYEWDLYNPGVFTYAAANCAENVVGDIQLMGVEFVKAADTAGYGIVNSSKLTIADCIGEIASCNFQCKNGSLTMVNGYRIGFWNNATAAVFETQTGACTIQASNIYIGKSAAGSGSSFGLIDTKTSQTVLATFSNVYMTNQNVAGLFASTPLPYWTFSPVSITNSTIVTGASVPYTFNMGETNLAWFYRTLKIANFTVAAGAGCTAVIAAVTHPKFTSALELNNVAGQQVYASTKVAIDQSIQVPRSDSGLVIEFSAKSDASTVQFYGRLDILWYDDSGAFISSTDLTSSGSIAHMTVGVAGLQDWKTCRRVLLPPAKAAQMLIRFGATTYTQKVKFGGIRVY